MGGYWLSDIQVLFHFKDSFVDLTKSVGQSVRPKDDNLTRKQDFYTEKNKLLQTLGNYQCQLIDFHAPSGIDGTHPRMFEWVRQYFTTDDRTEFRAPLYLQHQGHSRTIIGIEEHADASLKLLIFDPIYTKKQMQQFRSGINANMMRTIHRTTHGMKARQYQIVSVVGVLTEREFDDSKIIKSERLS